ncbi:hypothetical protein [Enterococcus innesii]|uniref:hypothetical protein n=1 Tax=Enterococcus innesii TaxID=2839759 RepID=UPI002DBB7FC4|nr:hypothetical protein [Enterococcus innesii]MEB5953162.1 hypothetical protein [Enterococcus innesii]
MKIEKEKFEKIILMSEYIDYYYHLLTMNLNQYEKEEQMNKMRYLIENNSLYKIKKNYSYSCFSCKYRISKSLQKEFKMLQEAVDFMLTIDINKFIPEESIEQSVNISKQVEKKVSKEHFKQLVRGLIEVL